MAGEPAYETLRYEAGRCPYETSHSWLRRRERERWRELIFLAKGKGRATRSSKRGAELIWCFVQVPDVNKNIKNPSTDVFCSLSIRAAVMSCPESELSAQALPSSLVATQPNTSSEAKTKKTRLRQRIGSMPQRSGLSRLRIRTCVLTKTVFVAIAVRSHKVTLSLRRSNAPFRTVLSRLFFRLKEPWFFLLWTWTTLVVWRVTWLWL